MEISYYNSERFTVDWTSGKARYHVWVSIKRRGMLKTVEIEDILYMNCDSTIPYKGVGYFATRKLDLSSAKHAKTRAAIVALATLPALETLRAETEAKNKAARAAEDKQARIAYLAQCVDAIRNANADELAEAMIDASPEVAAAAERLRAASTPKPLGELIGPY